MNEAIKLAIEKGGYVPKWLLNGIELDKEASKRLMTSGKAMAALIAQDPLFWQALGKALGWGRYTLDKMTITNPSSKIQDKIAKEWGIRPDWVIIALRYHELNLTGGDTEKFWKELLN